MLRMNKMLSKTLRGAYKNRVLQRRKKTTADAPNTGHSFSRLSPCPARSSFL